ncbi:Protein F59H6.5 [Aphelenchoides avenae]|nr:Protein F59H6.5 [Aphelenchus avenae]
MQSIPIEEDSLVSEQLNLSLKQRHLWQHFTTFKLTRNQRLNQGEDVYDKWTMAVGEGRNLSGHDGQEHVLDSIVFTGSLTEEVYGRLLSGDPTLTGSALTKYLAEQCILAVLNQVCSWYNDAIIDRFLGQVQVSSSYDEIVQEAAGDTRRFPTEMLTTSTLPASHLISCVSRKVPSL